MTDIKLPPKVVEAAARVLMGRMMVGQQDAEYLWAGMYEAEKEQFRREATAAIIAGLKAWPGMHTHEWQRPWLGGMSGNDIILPLPTSLQKMQTTQSGEFGDE